VETDFVQHFRVTDTDDLLRIAQNFGRPVPTRPGGPLVDVLFPRAMTTLSRSLSDRFGRDSFPYHTDMAYSRRVPRFLLMMSARASACATTVCDPTPLLSDRRLVHELLSAVYLIRRRRGSFLASVLDRDDAGGYVWRYDPQCMSPTSKQGDALLHELRAKLDVLPASRFQWNAGEALVLNNHRVLHGREPVQEERRLIYRIAVT